jgi:hypothetical protein
MEDFTMKLLDRNYKKIFTIILILALVLGAVAGISIPLSLGTQISEKSVLRQQAREEYNKEIAAGTLPASMSFDDYEDAYEDMWASQLTPLTSTNYILIIGLGVLCAALAAWYWITVMQWLYKMAFFEGMNPALWMTLAGFFNVFAVIAFFIARGKPMSERRRMPEERPA